VVRRTALVNRIHDDDTRSSRFSLDDGDLHVFDLDAHEKEKDHYYWQARLKRAAWWVNRGMATDNDVLEVVLGPVVFKLNVETVLQYSKPMWETAQQY